jgi:hypothetical protein
MHTTLSTTIARAAAVAGLSALAVLPSACAQQDDAAGCKDLPVPEVQQAIVLLAPGSGDALASAVSSLGSGSGEPLAAAGLGLAPASDGGDAPPATAVVLATYDDRGNVDPHGTFVLTGRGNDDRVRQRSARHEAQCLEEAASALPSAGAEAHPDLLRSLDRASGLGSQEAGAPRTSIVAIGLGTSAIDGTTVSDLDLSTAGQAKVFDQLDAVGLVPDLSSSPVGVRFLDPSQGVGSSISAEGVDAFATALCERIGADPCSSGPTLR